MKTANRRHGIFLAVVAGLTAVTIGVVAWLVVQGNSPYVPNTGISALARQLDGTPGVRGMSQVTTESVFARHNATGMIVMADDASDDQLEATLNAAGAFLEAQEADDPLFVDDVDLLIGTTTLRVYPDAADNAEQLRLRSSVPDNGLVTRAELYGPSLILTAAAVTDLPAVFAEIERLRGGSSLYADAVLTARLPDESSYITTAEGEGNGARPQAAIDVFSAVSESFPVISTSLGTRSAHISVLNAEDVDAATALAVTVAGSETIEVSIASGTTSKSGGGDFAELDTLIAPSASLPGVLSVSAVDEESGGNYLSYRVTDLETAQAVYDSVRELPAFAALRSFSIRSENFTGTIEPGGFSVSTDGAGAADAMALLAAVQPTGLARTFRFFDNSTAYITLRDAEEGSIQQMVDLVKPVIGDYVTLSILSLDLSSGGQLGGEFVTGGRITAGSVSGDFLNPVASERFRAVLEDAWNG